jgi:hypothetical protein
MTLAGGILMLIWQIAEDILATGRGIAMVPYRGKSPASNEELHVLQGSEDEGVSEETNAVKKDLEVFLEEEDLLWRQRAKTEWLRSGDQNTKFF